VTGCCEHGSENSCSIKDGVFLDLLSVLLASQEGLCSMELASESTKKKRGPIVPQRDEHPVWVSSA
jgi:hypothetical protein